jgi:cyanate permease
LALFVALLAVALSEVGLWLQLVAAALVLCFAGIEWRAQRRAYALYFDPFFISCSLTTAEVLEAEWPLPGMVNRYWISICFPGRLGRRRWLTIYSDQLTADEFRRLAIMLHR